MDNNQLLGAMQAFITVVDSGSFSECARRLGVSQPSVSRQVNYLEEQLGVRLLQRTTRRLSLTEAGQIYYEKARQIKNDVLEAAQSISGFKDTPSGTLKISAPHTWTETKITPYLGEFLSLYPELNIDIECNDSFQDMIEDRLDLVIRVGELKDSSFIAVPFGKVRMVLIATEKYLKRHGCPQTATDLQNHNCIVFEDYHRLIFNGINSSQEVSISGNVSANAVPVMLAAVLQDIGMTVLPDLLVNQLIKTSEVIDVMPEANIEVKNLPINQVFALYSNRKHLPAKVRAFLDFFKPRFH